MQSSAWVWPSVVSAVVSAAVAVYTHRQDAPGARGVAAFSTAAAVWAGGNAVQIAATTLDGKLLAIDAQYVGILAVPVAWFAFAAEYTDRGDWVTRRTVGALAAFPVVMFALVLTNEYHHLVRASATLETVDGTVRIAREFGAMFWVGAAYTWAVVFVGTVLLLEHALRVEHRYRRQTAAVLVGTTVPWLGQVAYFSGASTVEPEAVFGVTALAFGYAIVEQDFLDLVPVARNRIFEELHDGVVVLDGRRRVADYNEAAQRLLGVDVESGDDADAVLPAGVSAALESADSDPVRVDDDRWVSVDRAPVDTRGVGELVILRDVTELQRSRSRLDRKNERLERVADTVSHDLRNPVNVAEGHLELAADTGDAEHFERVQEALDRMDGIIAGTLRLARTDVHAPEKADVRLATTAEEAWRNVVTSDATLELDCGDAVVRADPDQLESVLENLFRNSVEHGSTDPQNAERSADAVEHGAANDAEDVTVTVGLVADGDGFYVADDGPGIPEDEREAAFERGYTTNTDGTGLGLAIVAEVADAHDWTVELADSGSGGVRLSVTNVDVAAERRARR